MDSARPSDEVGAAVADNQSDLVILGGGSGGYAAALRAAELGKSVVLIERDKVGGTCLHRGCIPTKALLHAGEIADQAREAAQFGVNATFEGIDMAGVHKYKDGVVSKNHKGLVGLITGRGIQIVEGDGRLSGPKTVTVNDDTYTGANVILATGSYSRTLPGLDLDGQRVIASEHALRLDHVPASAIVLGGGVIGVEFASAWRSFGSDVTIVEALPHLVPLEDEASSKLLERAFRRRGIAFKLGARFERLLDRDEAVGGAERSTRVREERLVVQQALDVVYLLLVVVDLGDILDPGERLALLQQPVLLKVEVFQHGLRVTDGGVNNQWHGLP
jgi:dihydrolipoamide dehydrogenase